MSVISVVETRRLPVAPERIWRFFAGGCELIQDVHMGFSLPLLGRLIDLVIAAVIPVRELRRHMREEQANLAPLLALLDERRSEPSKPSGR